MKKLFSGAMFLSLLISGGAQATLECSNANGTVKLVKEDSGKSSWWFKGQKNENISVTFNKASKIVLGIESRGGKNEEVLFVSEVKLEQIIQRTADDLKFFPLLSTYVICTDK